MLIVKKICFVLFVRSFVCLFFYLFPIASIFSPLYGFIFRTSQEIIRLIFHLIVINFRKHNLLIRMVWLTLLRTLWGRHDRKGLWGPWNTLVTHQTIQNYVSLHRNPVITLVSRNVKDFAVSAVDVKSSNWSSIHMIVKWKARHFTVVWNSKNKLGFVARSSWRGCFNVHIISFKERGGGKYR